MESRVKLTKKEYFLIVLCVLTVLSIAITAAVTGISGKYTSTVTDSATLQVAVVTSDDLLLETTSRPDAGYDDAILIYPQG